MLILYYVILVVHVFACLFLIGVVLLQQGKGQDLASAFGGGVTQTAFGPRGSANVLSRMTTILAGVFMISSLTLSVLRPSRGSNFLKDLPAGAPAAAPAQTSAPAAAPQAPAASPGTSSSAPGDTSNSAAPPSAATEVPGKTRPLTDKDVGPDAK
jgi:preprotein translocase subunit SecG